MDYVIVDIVFIGYILLLFDFSENYYRELKKKFI